MLLRRVCLKKPNLPSFLQSLIFWFITIIIICTMIMGILSYNVLSKFIFQRTLSTNNKMLYQYKNTTDSLILETINDISMKIKLDINRNYFLVQYINSPVENNMGEISTIGEYLTNMSIQNRLIYSLGIYYPKCDLLVSTEYVRHTLFTPLEKQNDLMHFKNIVLHSANSQNENTALIFDYGKNYFYKLPEYMGKKVPYTVIHSVRPIYDSDNTLIAAIVLSVSGDVFQSVSSKYAPEDLGSIFIINNDGLIISHTNNEFIGRNVSELDNGGKLLEINNDSGYFISNVDGIPAVISYQQSKYSNWRYISVAPMEAISSVANYILKIVCLIALLSISIGLLISIGAARKLAKPLKLIANYCLKSPYSTKEIKDKNEYSLISNTINNLENIMEKKEKEFKQVLPMLRMNFLSSLLSDNPPDISEINARMKMLNISFPHKYFCAAALKLERLKDLDKVVVYEYEKLNIGSQLEKIFTSPSSKCFFCEKDNIIVVLFNFDFDEDTLYKHGEGFLEQIQKQTLEPIHETISISKCLSFGKIDTNLLNMGASLKFALTSLDYCFVFPEKNVFTLKDIISRQENRSISTKLLLNNFSNSIKCLDYKKCISDLEKLINVLRDGNYSYQQIYTTLIACVSMVEDFICLQVGQDMGLDKDFIKIANIFEYKAWLKGILLDAFTTMQDASSKSNALIKKAQELIEKNIQNPQLSLEYIADELGISQKTLSRVFKNETGIKFIDYLTNLKLNYCRNLLISTNLKVEEISELMGYSTSQYFISRFKIMFGYTPYKYRQKYAPDDLAINES